MPRTTAVRVYRSGAMGPASDAGAAVAVTRAADLVRPAGHPARQCALFAAPTLPGVVRWVLAGSLCRYETRLREITLDPTTAWVYQVDTWERTDVDDPATLHAYWATSMPLSAWLARAAADGLDGADWEVVFAPSQVKNYRNVSPARLLATASEWRHPELRRIVRTWRR